MNPQKSTPDSLTRLESGEVRRPSEKDGDGISSSDYIYHYQSARNFIEGAVQDRPSTRDRFEINFAFAQIHATLAVAVATRLQETPSNRGTVAP